MRRDFARRRDVMIRSAFVTDCRAWYDDMADSYFRVEHARAAACDELARTARDHPIEHRGGHRSARARMHYCEPPGANLDLVHRMAADFADGVIDFTRAAVEDEIVDHVLEEAQHAMLRDVDLFVNAPRLDDGGRRGIVFEDRECARGQAPGGC